MKWLFFFLFCPTIYVWAAPDHYSIDDFLYDDAAGEEYINLYRYIAIDEMEKHKIPASVKMAQGILESNYGRSELATKANNHFGIKCGKSWTGETFHIMDDEVDKSCFRVYKNPEESYRAHSDFLKQPRYLSLYRFDSKDYRSWAQGLKDAGYATNPKYADIIIQVIERHKLYELDDMTTAGLLATNDKPNKPTNPTTNPSKPTATEPGPAISNNPFLYNTKKINGLKVVIANAGDTPLSIAKHFKTNASLLALKNEISLERNFKGGELVYLHFKRNKYRGGKSIHEVRVNETMYSISQMYGIKLRKLHKLNRLAISEQPAVGEHISLRKKLKKRPKLNSEVPVVESPAVKPTEPVVTKPVAAPVKPKPPVVTPAKNEDLTAPKGIIHEVQAKETLYGISKKYGVTVEEIIKINQLTSNEIKIGQKLKIK